MHQIQLQAEQGSSENALFACVEEGCVQTFFRHSSLMRHMDCGKHQRVLEHETILDKVAVEYAKKLETEDTSVPTVATANCAKRTRPEATNGMGT